LTDRSRYERGEGESMKREREKTEEEGSMLVDE
jgi:hypothetical protein